MTTAMIPTMASVDIFILLGRFCSLKDVNVEMITAPVQWTMERHGGLLKDHVSLVARNIVQDDIISP